MEEGREEREGGSRRVEGERRGGGGGREEGRREDGTATKKLNLADFMWRFLAKICSSPIFL